MFLNTCLCATHYTGAPGASGYPGSFIADERRLVLLVSCYPNPVQRGALQNMQRSAYFPLLLCSRPIAGGRGLLRTQSAPS